MQLSTNLRLALRFLWRDLRSGEIRLLAVALLLAVTAVTAVGFFTERVQHALNHNAHQLLAADLVLVSDQDNLGAWQSAAEQRGLSTATTAHFPSMVNTANGMQLADVKAVSPGYPLRGELRWQAQETAQDAPVRDIPAPGTVWLEPALAQKLNLHVGESLTLGQTTFTFAAYLTFEPDRSSNFLGVAPRLLLNQADLAATGLQQPGARISYRLLLAAKGENGASDATAVREFQAWLKPQLQRGQRLEDGETGRPEMRSVLERARRFLSLASLMTVALALSTVVLTTPRFLRRRLAPSAVLRCLGASQAQLMQIHAGELLALAVLVGGLGASLGWAGHFVLLQLVGEFLPLALPAASWLPWWQGLGLAVILCLGFLAPPVLQLSQTPTLKVLRAELGAPRLPLLLAYGSGFLALVLVILWLAQDTRFALSIAGGLLLVFAIFALSARAILAGLTRLLRRYPPQAWGAGRGLQQLGRRPWLAALQITALASSLTALLLLTVVQGELLATWQASVPADAPNRFVINIQPEQRQEVANFLQQAGINAELAPMIRGRLSKIDGKAVAASDYANDEQTQRLLEREFNLSRRNTLPPGNRLIAGREFQPEERGVISVEEGLAKRFGLGLGNRLTFTIGGQDVELTIVGLRQLQWDSMRVNFFVIAPENDLPDAPASYITSFHLPPAQAQVADSLIRTFPNLTLIDIAAIVSQLQQVISQLTRAVSFVFVFTLLGGGCVLAAALAAVLDEREYELALLRALGASRRNLHRSLGAELLAIGAIAGLCAGIVAELAGQLMAHYLFRFALPFHPSLLALSTLAGITLALGIGSWQLRRLWQVSPLLALRRGY